MKKTAITACICTLDRLEGLTVAFHSLLAQHVDKERVDLLIVDNGSTTYDSNSASHDLLNDATKAGFSARYVVEPNMGLSNARNRAQQETDADWIAFIDDDEIASPQFLQSLLDVIDREPSDSTLSCLGGPLLLVWPENTVPEWFSSPLAGYYTGLDLGPDERDLSPRQELLFGGNLAVHRETVNAVGGFNAKLSRHGHATLLGMEDTLIQFQIADLGRRIRYVPAAKIDHITLPERVSQQWILARAFGQGRSEVRYKSILHGHGRPRLALSACRSLYNRRKKCWSGTTKNDGAELTKPQSTLLKKVHRAQFFGAITGLLRDKW